MAALTLNVSIIFPQFGVIYKLDESAVRLLIKMLIKMLSRTGYSKGPTGSTCCWLTDKA